IYLCFFLHAEDGIRDFHVTGVQTCALPILIAGRISDYLPGLLRLLYPLKARREGQPPLPSGPRVHAWHTLLAEASPPPAVDIDRSEERRVGKGCRCRVTRGEER